MSPFSPYISILHRKSYHNSISIATVINTNISIPTLTPTPTILSPPSPPSPSSPPSPHSLCLLVPRVAAGELARGFELHFLFRCEYCACTCTGVIDFISKSLDASEVRWCEGCVQCVGFVKVSHTNINVNKYIWKDKCDAS